MRLCAYIALLFVLLAVPVGAQDWNAAGATGITERMPDAELLIRIPGALPGTFSYRIIDFKDLLAGVVDFPDRITRYVTSSATEGHIFTVSELTIGSLTSTATTSPNELTCAPYPTITGAIGGWVAVAVPADVGLPFIAIGAPFNSGLNQQRFFHEQAGNPVQIPVGSMIDYDIYVSQNPLNLSMPTERNLCFRSDAVLP